MSRPRLRSILIGLLILLLIIPAYFSFVSSSTGYIRINSTSSSTSGQQVQAGGDINLYFGQVTWSSNATFLFMSTNGQAEITSGDFVFTPKFSVHDLSNNTVTTYNSDSGNWVVGNNWVNGTIDASTPIGNYYIKAFDQMSSATAVTDTYITVYSTGYSATLNISRSSGPGGVPIQFTGSGYLSGATVTIAYLDPALGTWNYLANTTADGAGQISVNSSVPDLKKSVGNGDFPQTVTQISYRSQIGSTVYGTVSYDEYSRGLTQVGSQYANGLFGNGTTFGSNIRFKSGDIIQIAGQWWHPNSLIYLRWDGYDVVGTVTSDQWLNANIIGTTAASATNGTFLTNITIPDCAPGAHYLAIEDSQTRITVQIFVSSATLQISPSSGAGGVNTQFTGSGYPYLTSVNISYLDPYFGTWNYWTTTTSNSTGNIVINSQIPDLKRSQSTGDYGENYNIISFRAEVNGAPCAYASFNEYLRGLTQVGTSTANGLYGNGTDLSSNVNVNVGDRLLISGRYFHPGIVYIKLDGVNVVGTVTGSEWASTEATGSTTASDPTGSFSTTITIPSVNGGSHFIAIEDTQTIFITKVNVSAAVIPNPTPTPTPTPTPSSNPNPTPTPAPTPNPSLPTPALDLSCKSTTQSTDFSVEIDGKLSLNGTPLTDMPIQISYNNGKWQSLTTVNTLSDGTFVVAWHPDVTGNYLIEASWAGNSSMNGVSKTVTLAITYDPDLQQNYFKLTSNSTITQFAFNSTSKELSFTVSGPPETTGYVNIYIPKTLIADISTLKTYIDGNEVTFNSESQGDSWLISFSYSHSTHLVTMDLGNAVQPYNGTSNPDWSTYGIPIAVVAVIAVIAGIATVFVKRRKGTK